MLSVLKRLALLILNQNLHMTLMIIMNFLVHNVCFFKLWGNEQQNAGIFSPGQKVAEKGEHPVLAQVIISGEVVVTDKNGEHFFGPGSVFGLAEGLCH
jgi:hypothetical protein